MNTKSVPAIIMLIAGFVACVAGIVSHMDVADFMKMLLIVLIVFYILGCIVKLLLDRNFPKMQEEETTDGEETEEEEESLENEEPETAETVEEDEK